MNRLMVGAVVVVMTLASWVQAQTFKVDPVHSVVVYRIQHFNAGQFYGRFNEPQGVFTLDAENPANSKFEVTIDAAKVDTGNQKRDAHLKSPDFFNARQYPTITFKSTKVEKSGETYQITGDVTLLGQTRSITAEATVYGPSKDPQGNTRAGVEAVLTVKRSDFGMDFMADALGDEVRLIVSLEGVQE